MSSTTARPVRNGSDVHVDTSGDDHVAVVEIRRAPNNWFDIALIADIADACEVLGGTGSIRAIVLCSDGRHFCAGADFSGRTATTTTSGAVPADVDPGRHLYDEAIRIFEQPLPIVAAVQGAAIGGGMGLALAADFRVATTEARFAANFARLGFHHGFALSATLPRLVGEQAALDLLLTGRRVDGEEALALGLCDRLTEPPALRAAARSMAVEIAASAPLAVRSIRETMRGDLAERARVAMARERSEQDRLMGTDDWREGVAATRERRAARFTGR